MRVIFIHMLCPNCGQQMNVRNADNEIVLHCTTCGSSFFDKGGIDKITSSSAKQLSEDAQGQYILGNQKLCPKDNSILFEKVDANLPKNTVLLECPTCDGVFVYPDDLLKYKGLTSPKPLSASAFKLLPAPKGLFMLASFAVLTLAVLLNIPSLSNLGSSNARAEKIVGKVYLSESGPLLSVSFKTEVSETSTIVFYDQNRKETGRYVISSQPKKIHVGTVRGFDKERDAFYTLVFSKTSTSIAEVMLEN